MTEEEVLRITRLLDKAVRDSRTTKKSIEKRMGWSAGYMTRLMRGVIELKLRHIFDIAAMIGVEPANFFHSAYPGGPITPSAPAPPSKPPLRVAMLTEQELSERIENVLESFLRRQHEPPAEPEAIAEEPEPPAAPEPDLPPRRRRVARAG